MKKSYKTDYGVVTVEADSKGKLTWTVPQRMSGDRWIALRASLIKMAKKDFHLKRK